jgi:hypothetical protein
LRACCYAAQFPAKLEIAVTRRPTVSQSVKPFVQ